MASTTTDRRFGVNSGRAVKVPCRIATTANITLSGLQTIDGVALAADDRVLVKDQTTQTDNGIWVASSGAWTRAVDFNGNFDITEGTLVRVNSGTSQGDTFWTVSTTGTITIGTSNITFAQSNNQLNSVKTLLSGNITRYISTTGNNSNDGLTTGTAWATAEYAYLNIQQNYDLGGTHVITFQFADGTYTQDCEVWGMISPGTDEFNVIFKGNTSTPSSVIFNGTFGAHDGAHFAIEGMRLQTTTGLGCLEAHYAGSLIAFRTVEFGTTTPYHCYVAKGGIISAEGNYAIVGNAARHIYATLGGIFNSFNLTTTLTGTPAFSQYFCYCDDGGGADFDTVTFSGSATGQRFLVVQNGWIDTHGNSLTYLPGNSAGQAFSGGRYNYYGPQPTMQIFTSGSGTYSRPDRVSYIDVELVGGGGGGGASGSGTAGNGTAGGNTTFSTLTANGGGFGVGATSSPVGGGGGTATGGDIAITGSAGMPGNNAVVGLNGGNGASSFFGGHGVGGLVGNAGSGAVGYGSGGGGAAGNSTGFSGGGGGAGGYCRKIITQPSSSYSYSVGTAGSSSTAGSTGFGGGRGSAGAIIVKEYY